MAHVNCSHFRCMPIRKLHRHDAQETGMSGRNAQAAIITGNGAQASGVTRKGAQATGVRVTGAQASGVKRMIDSSAVRN